MKVRYFVFVASGQLLSIKLKSIILCGLLLCCFLHCCTWHFYEPQELVALC